MDKDKGYNDINDSIKKALDIMESPSELNEKETSGALEDDECLQTCRDIMDMNVALQQQQTPGSIDVEAELVRFKANSPSVWSQRRLSSQVLYSSYPILWIYSRLLTQSPSLQQIILPKKLPCKLKTERK